MWLQKSNKAGSVVGPPKLEGFLFVATEISQELLAAYQATEYWVGATPDPFCLYVGRHSAPLARLLDDSGCGCAAFISAHNPFSEPRALDANVEAHESLRQALDDQSTVLIEASGGMRPGFGLKRRASSPLDFHLKRPDRWESASGRMQSSGRGAMPFRD